MLKAPKDPAEKPLSFKIGYWTAGAIIGLGLAATLVGLIWLFILALQALVGVL